MASLVAPLVSGISTAISGSVEFFAEGTSTLADVYSDAHGETQVTTHALDARGGIVRYVKERVDVLVRDVEGAEVLQFTWGTDAREARLENLGFTGPNATGQIIGGGRTTVDEAFTRLYESLGATDGQVLVNGVASSMFAALSGSAGLVYNVKNVYGAVGDGVHDDGPNIQNAINAAEAAGGGIIYFSHGTYLITTPVVVSASTGKLFFLGEAASGTFLKQASGTTMLTLGAGNEQLLMNLTCTATAANTGALVAVGTTARATFVSCTFAPLNGTTIALGAAATSRANLFGCTIAQAGASSRIASGTGYLRLVGCELSTAGANLTSFSDAVFVQSIGCNWVLGSAIAAGTTHIYNNSGGSFHVVAGEITSLFTSGTVNICTDGSLKLVSCSVSGAGGTMNAAGAAATLREAACSFNGVARVGLSVSGYSLQREHVVKVISNSNVQYTPEGSSRIHEFTSDGATMLFNNPDPAVPEGSDLIILYKNTSGGNITPTFGTAYSLLQAATAVNAGNTALYYFTPKFTGSITADLVNMSPQVAGGVAL